MVDSTSVRDERLSSFLESFPTPLHIRQPESSYKLWVFWTQDEASQNTSSQEDLGNKLKSVFSKAKHSEEVIVQFWALVTIGDRRLLSTSGQPFAVSHLDKGLGQYRLRSVEYYYNIDENYNLLEDNVEEHDPMMIINGAPATAFLNRLPEAVHDFQGSRVHQGSLLEHYVLECGLMTSCMLPIFHPHSQGSCVGVIEYSISTPWSGLVYLKQMNKALEEVGLRMYHVQESIPYKTTAGLKSARDEIEKALKIVCPSHNISLAQVWIASEDKYRRPFSSLLEDTEKKQTLAFKMTGYCVDVDSQGFRWVHNEYNDFCDMFPLKMGDGIIDRTLEDYKPRFCKRISKLSFDSLMRILTFDGECSSLVICLRSIDTGDISYAFEFIWPPNSNYVIFLEALLLTLKKCLPNFKFASGAELDDELYVINVKNSTRNEINFLKIFQGNRIPAIPETLEKVKRKRMVEGFIGFSETKGKTDPILLPREVIEQQFGNTMKEAAKNLNVSLSTLKRKCKDFGISEWQGPQHVVKRKVNEEDNRAIQYPSAVNSNENTLTIKAECANDMIKFHLRISQATFATVRNEISKKFKFTLGTYQLKYRDEDGDWILLISDQDMSDCIKTLINLNQTVLRLRVVPSTQPLSGPIGSNEISCT